VETLIAIAMFAKLNSHDIKIKIIGGDDSEISRFREMIAKGKVSSYFDLRGQLAHEMALRELKKSEIVILTKSADENYAGFPLKAIEALASGRITIVEESDVYKNIFNNGAFVIWFNRELIDKIFLQIESTMRDGKLDLKLKRNVEIAKKFTWINRTLNLLAKIGNN
jgi:Glycosyl transferases group 1